MCGLFGLIDYKSSFSARQKEKIIKILSVECEERGTDAAGIAYTENGNIKIYKRPLPAHKIKFKLKSNPSVIIGHTRMTTQGNEKFNYNNHPFRSEKLGFALAHNGVIYNDKDLKKSEKLPKTNIQTDTYIAVQLIEKKRTLNFKTLKFMAEKIKGSFCFTLLDKYNNFYIIKGDNPVVIYDFKVFYIYASTKSILDKVLKKLKIKLKYNEINLSCGDILKFLPNGTFESGSFEFSDFVFQRYGWSSIFSGNYESQYQNDVNDEYLEDLIKYAEMIGVNAEDIEYLLENGYDYFDIEEMLYEPEMLEYCLYRKHKDLLK